MNDSNFSFKKKKTPKTSITITRVVYVLDASLSASAALAASLAFHSDMSVLVTADVWWKKAFMISAHFTEQTDFSIRDFMSLL